MPELALKLTSNGLVLLIALIAWGLENRWHDRRTKTRRRWTRVLIALLDRRQRSSTGSVTVRDTHGQEQEEQERAARIEEGVQELVKLARERDPTLTEQEALREIVGEIQALRGRTSELEGSELEGVKRYGSVAMLNMFGVKGEAGAGLRGDERAVADPGRSIRAQRGRRTGEIPGALRREGDRSVPQSSGDEPGLPVQLLGAGNLRRVVQGREVAGATQHRG